MAAPTDNDRGVSPLKLSHVLFATRRLASMRDWYRTVLEARVVFESPELCLLAYDDEHHRIAFATPPGLQAREAGLSVGLHHVAFTYRDLDALLHTYVRLKRRAIAPFWSVNHGPTISFYYRDPDLNRIELQVDAFTSAEDLGAFMAGDFQANPVGVEVDPDQLVACRAAGVPFSELRCRPVLPPGTRHLDLVRW